MKSLKIKRKIYNFKTLERRLVKKKFRVSPFVQVDPRNKKKTEAKKIKKDKNISTTVRLFSTCYY